MSNLNEYTLELYRANRRVKGGVQLIEKIDFAPVTRDYIDTIVRSRAEQGFVVKLSETIKD